MFVLKNYLNHFQLLLGIVKCVSVTLESECLLVRWEKLTTQFTFVSLLLSSIEVTKVTEIIRMALLIEVGSLGSMEIVMVY